MSKKILIVDDDPNVLEILEKRLSGYGYDVIGASDGQRGLEEAKRHRPDLLILDILLPKMNGFKVCEEIKKEKGLESTPIIMFTAVYIDEVDKEIAHQLGADKYLIKPDIFMTKPYVPQELLKNIKILLKEKEPEEAIATGQKILIVDDDQSFLVLAKDRLEREGYLIYTACDGQEALDIMVQKDIDIVLLDIQLPKLDGIQLLAKIKKKWPNISVVMVSAYGSQEVAIEAMRKGADDFITKPFDNKLLLIRIKRNLEKAKLKRQRDQLISILKNSNFRLMDKYEDLEILYKKLNEKTETLKRFHKVTVDRELEMVKLKKEINSLLEELGQPKRYKTP